MNVASIRRLLEKVHNKKIGVDEALKELKLLPFEDLGFAKVDSHRSLRKGFPEVIMGEGKTTREITEIMKSLTSKGENILVTRVSPEKVRSLKKKFPKGTYHTRSRAFTVKTHPVSLTGKGTILVISAGTSDIPVAEEAVVTASMMGNRVQTLYDVGVAGIHRLLNQKELLQEARVLVVVAGMEGALASVVGGIVDKPIVAVPTSVGYGASFHGLAALLGMLNTCAAGIGIVNIDNGFGAGYLAGTINQLD